MNFKLFCLISLSILGFCSVIDSKVSSLTVAVRKRSWHFNPHRHFLRKASLRTTPFFLTWLPDRGVSLGRNRRYAGTACYEEIRKWIPIRGRIYLLFPIHYPISQLVISISLLGCTIEVSTNSPNSMNLTYFNRWTPCSGESSVGLRASLIPWRCFTIYKLMERKTSTS